MLTVSTCPTITLERLARQFDLPKTLTESILLKGVQAEMDERSAGGTLVRALRLDLSDVEETAAELQKEVNQLKRELEKQREHSEELEERLLKGKSADAIEAVVESASA